MVTQPYIPFQSPPKKFRGMLVIESDDGTIGDYQHWHPLLQQRKQKSQWYPFTYPVVACSAVNSDKIGTAGHMSVAQLHELESAGWEIMNHGANHAGLGLHRLQDAVPAGTTIIRVSLAHSFNPKYDYRIVSESTGIAETVKMKSLVSLDSSTNIGEVELMSPLVNNHVQQAFLELTPESRELEINGGLDALLGWGLDVKHYVNPYHFWYSTTLNKIKERHLSTRTFNGTLATNTLPVPDLYKLTSNLDGVFSEANVIPFIDKIYEEDSVGIIYGHGYAYTKGSVLDKLIVYAIDKGVKIVTRDEAYQKKLKP